MPSRMYGEKGKRGTSDVNHSAIARGRCSGQRSTTSRAPFFYLPRPRASLHTHTVSHQQTPYLSLYHLCSALHFHHHRAHRRLIAHTRQQPPFLSIPYQRTNTQTTDEKGSGSEFITQRQHAEQRQKIKC